MKNLAAILIVAAFAAPAFSQETAKKTEARPTVKDCVATESPAKAEACSGACENKATGCESKHVADKSCCLEKAAKECDGKHAESDDCCDAKGKEATKECDSKDGECCHEKALNVTKACDATHGKTKDCCDEKGAEVAKECDGKGGCCEEKVDPGKAKAKK